MQYISISGPVAAGKTTLVNHLLELTGNRAAAHEELPELNPFIRDYYSDSKRWSFHSQVTFLSLYFENPDWLPERNAGKDFFFFDRSPVENLVLARQRMITGDLTPTEFEVIERLGLGIASLMPPISRTVYLDCSVELLLEHTRMRGRDYEKALDADYAVCQKRLYEEWIRTLDPKSVLVVPADRGVDPEAILSELERR